ncbi:uncharacterized protein, partial [Halyomorpha halys]|uniref:uncharacterized protein n=1 Tax=Halyomorpha halys TaxID=286706 RepID=UPI0006D4DE70
MSSKRFKLPLITMWLMMVWCGNMVAASRHPNMIPGQPEIPVQSSVPTEIDNSISPFPYGSGTYHFVSTSFPEIDSRGFHEGMFDGIGDYYPAWSAMYSKRMIRSSDAEEKDGTRRKRDVAKEEDKPIKVEKKAGGRYVRGMEMGSSGFHGDVFNSGFGDFVTMRRRRRLMDKRRPEMDSMGFHGDTFRGGFGEFETMKKRAKILSGIKNYLKRRPEMDSMGFHGDTFSRGFGDFDTMKKRRPEMDSM